MKIIKNIRPHIHHIQLAAVGFLVFVLLAACNSKEFVEDANQSTNSMPSIPASTGAQQNQDAQRRPFPTPFPTVEVPPTPTPTPEPSEDLDEELELSVEDLESAFAAALYADALSASIATENLTSGQRESVIYEFIRPDRFHLLTANIEVVVSDGLTYRRQSGTNWLISPVQAMEEFDGIFDPYLDDEVAKTQLDDLLSNATDVQVEGQRMVDGAEYYVVTYKKNQPADPPPQTTTVWIGVKDGLLYRQIIDFVENEQNYRTTIAYAYGEDVAIARPYP